MFFNILEILANVNIYFLLGFFVLLATLAAVPAILVLLLRLPLMLFMLFITSIKKFCKSFNKQEASQSASEEETPANAGEPQPEKRVARTAEADVIYMTASSTPQSVADRLAMVRKNESFRSHVAPIGHAADRAYQRNGYRRETTSADWRQMRGQLEHAGNSSPLARRELSSVGSR
jgi:cytoskeletal protein RodZ